MQPTKKEMIDKIYKEIARKDLSFGCMIERQFSDWSRYSLRILSYSNNVWVC